MESMTITEVQQQLSSHLRTMKMVHPNGRVLTLGSYLPDQFRKSRSEEDKLNDVLQWIALCFMTGGHRKNVAVAFTSDDTSVTFYVTSYPDRAPNDSDKAVMKEFKQKTVNALTNMEKEGKNYTLNNDLDNFRSLIVKNSWQEICKKILKIRNPRKYTSLGAGTLLTIFEGHVNTWVDFRRLNPHPRSLFHKINPLPEEARAAREKLARDGRTVVASFKALVESKEPSNVTAERSAFVAQMLNYCEAIDTSDFMKDSLEQDRHGGDTVWRNALGVTGYNFLGEVRRHIRRLRMYAAGMNTYLKEGLKRALPAFRRLSDRTNFVKFNWIIYPEANPNTVPALKFPMDPTAWVRAHFSPLVATKTNGGPKSKIAEFNTKVSRLWTPGENICGNVHCEIALLSFLIRTDTRIEQDVFGTARAICYACQYFLYECHDRGFRSFNFTSGKTKVSYDWITPSVAGAEEGEWEKPCVDAVCKCVQALSEGALSRF